MLRLKMNVQQFVKKYLYNSRNCLEGQRLSEKWFVSRGFHSEFQYFKDNNILNSKNLYTFLNPNETNICECGSEKRFTGFSSGFKDYCLKCSKTKYNHMKRQGYNNVHINDVVAFVKDVKGNYSTSKIKKLSQQTIQDIIERTNYLDEATRMCERLYHIEHGLYGLPKCKLCGKDHNNFRFGVAGYFEYCKGECSHAYNANDRKNGLRIHFYERYLENFKSDDDYDIVLFTKEDYLEDKECLIAFKHKKCGHEYKYSKNYQGHFRCPKCYPIRSKAQYEIFDWLDCDSVMNDRQLIKPKEIDILSYEFKFGIEYDSLMFHSFGESNYNPLNNILENKNIHLEKTESCEEKGIQLFRIFSNEWHNKQDIWKSMLLNKIGKNEKIFARKCLVKEVDSKTCNSFLEKNHMQGKATQFVRLGLYYNDELVSLMTFGKPRYNKNIEWELIRFCTKLNTQVIGGASKLLKYFERNYNPKSIISYANRRWSQGDLYEKLGFEYTHSTKPNYFYFHGKDGDSAVLESRVKYQKHKLKDKLETFDPNLSETENMYNNGYRKIFDCGNKVYVRKY